MHTVNYDSLLGAVARPCRYLGSEWNAIHKDLSHARARFCLCYPDTYEVGMSHLGLRILYDILNARPECVAERAFAPWGDMEAALRAAGLPLASLESRAPLREFDVVGFTLAYELTYTNLLTMLDLGGIPLKAADRSEQHPIVIAGGPGAANPEPMADFLDAVVLGEAEEAIVEIAATVAQSPPRAGRQALLEQLAKIAGVYVPCLYRADYDETGVFTGLAPVSDSAPPRVRSRLVEDFDAAPYPTRQIVPYMETVHDRVVLEIMRGCTRSCRFCQAGMTYRPTRQRRVATVLGLAEKTIAATGFDEISLLGFNSPDYTGIEELLDGLIAAHGPQGVSISLPSSRTDTFSVELAQKLARVRRPGLTLAPEAGSQRLRDVINKQVTEADLFGAVEAALHAGWDAVKLYFMIGLPTESEDDVLAIADLLERTAALGRQQLGTRRGRLRITASIGCFVPKPQTPFQWWGQDDPALLAEKQSLLLRAIHTKEVKPSWPDVKVSRLEAALARGDRRLGEVVLRAWQAGARFDSWSECLRIDAWQQAFDDAGVSWERYANRDIPFDEALPWGHIDYGVSPEFLRREAEAAMAGLLTPDCRSDGCSACGACDRAALDACSGERRTVG